MSMTDAVALALAHYRATTTTGIQIATTGSWWPILIAIRGVSADTLAQFRRGAAMRGTSQAQYLAALLELHARMRALADIPTPAGRWEQVATELEALGLQTMRE